MQTEPKAAVGIVQCLIKTGFWTKNCTVAVTATFASGVLCTFAFFSPEQVNVMHVQ